MKVTDFAEGLEEVWGFSYHRLSNDFYLDPTLGSLFFKKIFGHPTDGRLS